MSTDGRRLLSALVQTGDLKTYTRLALSEEFFKGGEAILFEYVYNHVMDYGKLPHPQTVIDNVGEDALVEVTEPADFYHDKLMRRYTHNTLKEAVLAAQEFLKDQKPEDALEILADHVTKVTNARHRQNLFDFRDVRDLIHEEYKKTKADTGEYTLQFGWPFIDDLAGGIREGDFISIVGRPASGKTFLTVHGAKHNWDRGHQPLLFSMEMARLIMCQRLAAIHTHKGLTRLLKAQMSTATYHEMQLALKKLKNAPQPFWIVDGNLATTVDDMIMMARQLKPSIVYVDGAYLVQHKNAKMSKWDKIGDNAERMKQKIATDLGYPVVCSYQLKRETTKKKDDEKLGTEDIYGSDAIGQISSVTLGLLEAETVETMARRKVTVIKGRSGEVGEFLINWNFEQMDFSEVTNDTENLQFVG